MKVFSAVFFVSISFLIGCATQMGVGVGAPTVRGSEPGPTVDPQPDLGVPESNSNGGNSFFKSPSSSGPSLGLPEALADDPPVRSSKFRTLEPTPKSRPQRAPSPGTKAKTSASPTSASSRSVLADEPVWNRFYRSADLRPIQTLIFGNGPRKVVVLGSMHGDEPQSVALVDHLVRELKRNPQLIQDCTVLVIRSPNPDGLFARTALNIQGVDLNRNFPSANWHSLRDNRGGSRAGSEPETRAIMQVLDEFKPELLVHLKDSRREGIVNSEGNVAEIADRIGQLTSCRVKHDLGQATSGSIESYALSKLNCPSVTLLLPREQTDQLAWERNRAGLFALFHEPTRDRMSRPTDSLGDADPFEQRRVRSSSLRSSPKAKAKLPEFPMEVPDKGYVELPAP